MIHILPRFSFLLELAGEIRSRFPNFGISPNRISVLICSILMMVAVEPAV